MKNWIVTVARDLSQGPLEPGDIVQCFEGRLKIIDTKYQNQYGEFVLCEVLDERVESHRQDEKGVLMNQNNPFEVIGTLHMPGLRYFLTVPGFFLKERSSGKVIGYSFQEAFELLFQKGASNAEGVLKKGQYQSIEFSDGLPSFRSYYWKIQIFGDEGEAFAELTNEAKAAMERMSKSRRNAAQ